MTSRDAFFKVPKGTSVNVNDSLSSHHPTDAELPENAVVFGCGREGCSECAGLRHRVIERGGQFRCLRPSGAMEIFEPGNKLTITRPGHNGFDSGKEKLDPDFCNRELCENCRKINFVGLFENSEKEVVFFPTHDELIKSSKQCPLCALIASVVVDAFDFYADDSRLITLKGDENGRSISISFPSKEYGHDELISERRSTLAIYAVFNGDDTSSRITGRLPQSPTDIRRVESWLSHCMKNHAKCNLRNESVPPPNRPRRLIYVGSLDGSEPPRLEEGERSEGDYVTLSYRWGDASTITKTTTETISQFQDRLPLDSLSKVFRDAIEFTKTIGIKYIWIDSLCIVQDDVQEKAREISTMSAIYEGSVLTLSATLSTSGDSVLLSDREYFDLIKVSEPKNGEPFALYVTDQAFSDFTKDVPNGVLAGRAWCFQERLLSRRLLHFGRNQLHWECFEGIWSECSTKRQWYDEFSSIDDGELRTSLHSYYTFSEKPSAVVIGPIEEGGTERLDTEWNKALTSSDELPQDTYSGEKRSVYDAWYQAVSAYTNRELSSYWDKLPALAGAAVRFNVVIRDNYGAGIWADDLPQGLLWSRSAFERVQVNPNIAKRLGVGGWGEMNGDADQRWRGAPSWSWASVEGPVHWVRNRQGPVHIGPDALMTKPSGDFAYSGVEWGAIRVRGQLLEAQKLSWIRNEAKSQETQSEFEKWFAEQPLSSRPQLDPDDPGWEEKLAEAGQSGPLYFLLICSIPLISSQQTEQETQMPGYLLGYALMLRYWPADGAFRRVGIAKVALADFMNASPNDIYVL